jgi:riboflavin kinase/FMN adenylyltransferase
VAADDLDLKDGVWAGWFERADGSTYATAISIGVRSTFYGRDGVKLLEAHLLDFEGDLYGEFVLVSLAHRLRGQKTFHDLDGLIVQMRDDIDTTRRWSATPAARSLVGSVSPGLTVATSR